MSTKILSERKLSIITDQVDSNFEKACDIIQKLGYSYVEIHNVDGKTIEDCTLEEVLRMKQILNTYQLHVSNLATTIFCLCPLYEHYQISEFHDTFLAIQGNMAYHLKKLEDACKIAQQLSCHTLRVFPFRLPDNEDIQVVGTREDQIEIKKALRKAILIAEQYDITLLLENCPYSHCPKGQMTFEIVDEINSPFLKLLWDPANSYRAEKDRVPKEYLKLTLAQEYNLIHKQIAHVHLKNYTYDASQKKPFIHKALFDGDIDYASMEIMSNTTFISSL